ncbi:branched-chain amino acid transport system II carrier protein, partial [Thomasclavelia spiroformis]
MDKLSLKNTLIIGITLFSMFFGAGNLIFPPLIGAKSGEQFVLAILGFILTAVVIPTVAVIVVSKHRGLKNITDRFHPKFTLIFITLVYLLIGPCVAIPRTASTSFEMTLAPFISSSF